MLQTLRRLTHAMNITREISDISDNLVGIDRICFIIRRQRHPHSISDGPDAPVHVAVGPSGGPIAPALAMMNDE